jgi:sulfur carrier protein
MKTITLNGEKRVVENVSTVGDLLDVIGLAGKPVVVEHNQQALFPREIATAPVSDGDLIEIVQVTAGG